MDADRERAMARRIAELVREAGGRAFYVGGAVRDEVMGLPIKDVDVEVYGIAPEVLRGLLSSVGSVYDKGRSFGVLGLRSCDMDIAMPRRERATGPAHTDFDVTVDPFLSVREASRRRDFTVNAMLMDVLTGEIIDPWNGREDIRRKRLRCVSAETFPEDALRVFRACQFSARFAFSIDPETMELCGQIDVSHLSRERVYMETVKALMKAARPSVYFRALARMDHLREFFPELEAAIGVPQNPKYHPEGDVFEHTMLVVDNAADLRGRAREPLGFMFAALFHDLGKCVATRTREDGRIVAYGHEHLGLKLVEKAMRRLTDHRELIAYVVNQSMMHMRPNMLAAARSRKRKTRAMFDQSVCPEDLILLARADAVGRGDVNFDPAWEEFLRERLSDYYRIMQLPMVTGEDLLQAGIRPGPVYRTMLERARTLHFSGWPRERALKQVLAEFPPKNEGTPSK
ncbi:MAG: HD domain-containing protein [Clostridia bacterium]|nr:HD domain-containing protein [Clostridia bacterium]